MPRIRCFYIDCVFLDDGYCSAAAVEIDPDLGCSTYTRSDDVEIDPDWEEEDTALDEWDEIDIEDDDDDMWIDDEEF